MHNIRVAAKIVIGFIFSITILLTFLTLSLFGVEAQDTVRLIVTEATGLERDMVVFQATLQPLVIHNVFYLCLAGFGFILIFLYFIDHRFSVFLGPGVLCLVITFFLVLIVSLTSEQILRFLGPSTDMYIQTAIDRFRAAAIGMAIFGILLTALSVWGDKLFKKKAVKV